MGDCATRKVLRDFFAKQEKSKEGVCVKIEVKRIPIYSAQDNQPITHSWFKLKLSEYKGYKETAEAVKIFFFCDIYKNIYIKENQYNYILDAALRHNDLGIVEILTKYKKDREGYAREIQAEAC